MIWVLVTSLVVLVTVATVAYRAGYRDAEERPWRVIRDPRREGRTGPGPDWPPT